MYASETTVPSKSRNPSRCREWERQRRLKFNDAISKLGEIVKTIHKENEMDGGEKQDNVQYPKIEIIQKAILCLKNFNQEKTKLNNKYIKMCMLKKSKKGDSKTCETNSDKAHPAKKAEPQIASKSQLPKLLPITSNVKKGNTIVVLPAAPYILPQRPLLFPTAQPTIVLLDTSMQSLNKQPMLPVLNRNASDITKTTMVNILPISAYSHPISAAKVKKTCAKPKNSKKTLKRNKIKDESTNLQTSIESNDIALVNDKKNSENKAAGDTPQNKTADTICDEVHNISNVETSKQQENDLNSNNIETNLSTNKPDPNKELKVLLEVEQHKTVTSEASVENCKKPSSIEPVMSEPVKLDQKDNADKNKETKLQNILDTSICEHVVDGGNARLELAEEFLAASPTAAFLMSFPLVSGNRADSPSEEQQNNSIKDAACRNELQTHSFFQKSERPEIKTKTTEKTEIRSADIHTKPLIQEKDVVTSKSSMKTVDFKTPHTTSNENPFLPSIIPSTCTDVAFGLDFDCNINKNVPNHSLGNVSSNISSNNLFYKTDHYNAVKNTVYSTSSLSSGHDYNNLGLYPCAVENCSSKNKADYSNIEDNLIKMNSSRLTYDIDLGWSHKGLDFVSSTTNSNALHKDSIFTSTASSYTSAYNPFNSDFHVSLSNANKKEIFSKPPSFSDSITSFYGQASNLWTDDMTAIYTNTNTLKNTTKQQHYTSLNHGPVNTTAKVNVTKQFESKPTSEPVQSNIKSFSNTNGANQLNVADKFTKKSPSKMHINWMTSETRTTQNNFQQMHQNPKDNSKTTYGNINVPARKPTQNENYFPINMHHFPTQTNDDLGQMWPATRPAGTTEISIEPPPIHLPTLVGDLALGPHDKKRNDLINKTVQQADQSCSTLFSVTQIMNRSSENSSNSRSQNANVESKTNTKQSQDMNDNNRKTIINSRMENSTQHCYNFNDTKVANNFASSNQFSNIKSTKSNKNDKSSKVHKNNYSAEALLRGGTCSQKTLENTNKFGVPGQKFGDFNLGQDTSVAQVSHFPPLLDYTDSGYTGQQYSGTTLYNSTTNTMSNSFYSNFMPSGTNLMTNTYTGGPFTSEFVDYNNQTAECNYSNKYDEKVRNSSNFLHEKHVRREAPAVKHKLECTKKESSKKYQSKRAKVNVENEEWGDNSHLFWQNRSNKRHSNIIPDEIQFPNFVGNQMPTQYQPDFFNSHLMPSNVQSMNPGASFPVTSRANFNLSALFPEITTMAVEMDLVEALLLTVSRYGK
ncbi:unnamed protein product [Leptidea sinapis]|uniref:BHLH domain-containing protein n=1 Tax=Leptidea sinapis TaxID=189913 RepID=A0A5E4QZN2_9NEOP|nr:unnamed protein product [Leptidea sinapis]